MVNRRHCGTIVGMGQNWVLLEMNVKSLSFLKKISDPWVWFFLTHPKNDASLFPFIGVRKLLDPQSSPCFTEKSWSSLDDARAARWGWNPTPTPGFTLLAAAEVSSPRGKKEKHEEVNMWNTAVGKNVVSGKSMVSKTTNIDPVWSKSRRRRRSQIWPGPVPACSTCAGSM